MEDSFRSSNLTLNNDGNLVDLENHAIEAEDMVNEEEDEEEEEEESEPKLKYERLSNDFQMILKKDAASCIAVHPKFVCLGSHWGGLHILDHLGNVARQELPSHSMAVNMVAIDGAGEYVASCSDDGKVFISGLYTSENSHNMMLERPVKSVALDPNYSKPGSGRKFLTGDERLILHEKVFLSRLKATTLYEGEGYITNIQWRGRFVAWASNAGVRVYDMTARKTISLIKKDISPGLNPDNYRCHIYWRDDVTLVVGWVDDVKVCIVRQRSPIEANNLGVPLHFVEIVSMFTTIEFIVCGLGWLNSHLAILALPKDKDNDGLSSRPQMRLLEPQSESFTEISTDVLSIRGYQEYTSIDYHLECLPEEGLFFIVSPKDVVVAKPRDADDHVAWLLEHEYYEAALAEVTGPNGKCLKRHTALHVGRIYLDHLLQEGDYESGARLCVTILGKDKKLWEEEVFKFARLRQLRVVTPYLPRGDCRLDPHIYEMVLFEFLKTDAQGFLRLIKEWSPTLYHVPAVMNAVLEHILRNDRDNPTLLLALALLYSFEKKYDRAFAMYLRLQHPDVFKLIAQHQLFPAIQDKINELMELDSQQAIALFLEHQAEVSPDLVVAKLEARPSFLFKYLDALYQKDAKDASRKFHGRLVRLYADFAKDKLLPFLKASDHYPIQEALQICQSRHFIPEMVFLLARMGNSKEALQLITTKLGDIHQAIEFCKSQDDRELWEDLIDHSLTKPSFINVLLRNIGTHVDPRILILRIEKGLKIPGLRDSLVKILQDYNLQIALQEECQKILVADCFGLHNKLLRMQQRGMVLRNDTVCGVCDRKLLVKDARQASSLTVFGCRHAFHDQCLSIQDACVICHTQKQEPGLVIKRLTPTSLYKKNM